MYLSHAGQNMLDMIQDKVVTVQDLVDTFQNTTEASIRKSYHEVVGLLQNMSCSLDGKTQVADNLILELHTIYSNNFLGTEELQKQLENITESLQHQLQSCNGTDLHPIPPSFMPWDNTAEFTLPTWLLQD